MPTSLDHCSRRVLGSLIGTSTIETNRVGSASYVANMLHGITLCLRRISDVLRTRIGTWSEAHPRKGSGTSVTARRLHRGSIARASLMAGQRKPCLFRTCPEPRFCCA